MGGFAALAGLLGGAGQAAQQYGQQIRGILGQRRGDLINVLGAIGTPEALQGAARIASGKDMLVEWPKIQRAIQGHIEATHQAGLPLALADAQAQAQSAQTTPPARPTPVGVPPGTPLAAQPGTSPVQGVPMGGGGGANLAGLFSAAQTAAQAPPAGLAGLPLAAQMAVAATPVASGVPLPVGLAAAGADTAIPQPAQPGTPVPSIQETQALGGSPLLSPMDHLRRVSQMTGYSPAEMMTFPSGRAMLNEFALNEAQLARTAGFAQQEIQWKQQALALAKRDPNYPNLPLEVRVGLELAASTPNTAMPNFLGYGLRAEMNAQFRNRSALKMSADEAKRRWPDLFEEAQIGPEVDTVTGFYNPVDLMKDPQNARPVYLTGMTPKGPIPAYDLISGQLVSANREDFLRNPKLRPAGAAPKLTDRIQLFRTDDGKGNPVYVAIDMPTLRTVGQGPTPEAAAAQAGAAAPVTAPLTPGGQTAAPVTPPVGPAQTTPSPVSAAPSVPGASAGAGAAGAAGGPAPAEPTGRVKPGDIFRAPAFPTPQARAKAKGVLDAYGLTLQRAQWVYDHTDLLKDPARVARMQILLNTINPHSGSAIGGVLQGLGGAVAAAFGSAVAGPAGAAAGAGLGPLAKAMTPAVEAALARTFDLSDDEVDMVVNHAILQENIMLLRQQFGIGFRNEQALAYQENQIGNLLTSDRVTHRLVGNAINELSTQYKDLAEPLGEKAYPVRLDKEQPEKAPPPTPPPPPAQGAGNIVDVPVERDPRTGKLRVKK